MSYGWLTESAIIPNKSKKINVSSASLVDLQVILDKEKKKKESQGPGVKMMPKPVPIEQRKNPGVEERSARDAPVEEQVVEKQAFAIMERKAKIYDMLNKAGSSTLSTQRFLVDFDRKKDEEFRAQEDFDQKRKDFYDNLKKDSMAQSMGLPNANNYKELSLKMDLAERERLQWEKEALEELDEDLDQMDCLRKRYNVKQSTDIKLSKETKEKLEQVQDDLMEEKKRNEDVKKLKQQAAEDRLSKLKKLKLV